MHEELIKKAEAYISMRESAIEIKDDSCFADALIRDLMAAIKQLQPQPPLTPQKDDL